MFRLVLENVMNLLVKNGDWEPDKISLFQFVGLFRGKHLTPFIENLAHESWITSNLTCTKPDVVKEVMDRLKNVPVVPPLESLRHIGLCLLRENKEITAAIGKDMISIPFQFLELQIPICELHGQI